jgi:hypothetical protein
VAVALTFEDNGTAHDDVKPAGFHPDGGPWQVSVGDFLDGIARSIEALG